MTSPDLLSLVGMTISDKYEIEKPVGEGGFAVVYRARHIVWNRPVAIKVFRALVGMPPEQRAHLVESFIQEGRLLADLSERSAAICQARDVGTLRTPDGRELPYMVLEWLEGRSLDLVLESEMVARMPPRTLEEALRILEPAAEALALAHRSGIAHRDVKPANLFILGDPRGEFTVKLLDFGIAKVVQDAQRLAGSFAQTKGVISSFTPAYGAPEQFSRTHGSTGPWTDVFALALILTELVTQEPPLRGDDLTQLAFASMDPLRRPTPRTYGASLPDAVEAVLRRALAVAPKDRFASMGEFWNALRSSLSMDPRRSFMTSDTMVAPISTALTATALAPPASVPFSNPGSVPGSASGSVPGSAPVSVPGAGITNQSGFSAGSQVTSSKGSGARLAFAGLGVALVVGVAAVGAWSFVGRKQGATEDGNKPVASVASSGVAPLPVVSCPEGMMKIPGGKFFMGTDDPNDEEHERPAHQVTLSPYCMDTTEVTVAAYKACSDRGECKRAPRENEWEGITAFSHKLYDPLCNIREPKARANQPINCLDWELADAFCKAVGKRLPTEAEWEFATRGSDGRRYPWGDDPPTNGGHLNACGTECLAWAKAHPDPDNPLRAMYLFDDGFATTAPVGSFPKGASPFGLQDVVGNVWEWVSDWYAPYTPEPSTNPKGAETGTERVLRGGAWNGSDPAWVRPTYRFKSSPKLRSYGIGVRCAKTL